MKIKGFDHIGLFVVDSGKSLAFYEKLGGRKTFEFSIEGVAQSFYMVELAEGAVLELIPRGVGDAEQNPRFAHIALEVDDVPAAFDEAIAIGATERTAPKSMPLGTRRVSNAFVFGPDGEVIEFFSTEK